MSTRGIVTTSASVAVGAAAILGGALVFASPAYARGHEVVAWGQGFGPVPKSIDAPRHVAQVVTSNSDVYVLSKGHVWAAGVGDAGELGNGTDPADETTKAVEVDFPSGVSIASLAPVGPRGTMLAIDTDHNAWGWGQNAFGQLCLGDTTSQNVPVKVPLSDVTLAAGAGDHATYDAGGKLYSCGSDRSGELGNGSMTGSLTPVPVTGLPTSQSVVALTASWRNEGAVLANGTYWNWGYNTYGELGNGTTQASAVPVEVPLESAVVEVSQGGGAAADGQTFALLADGTVWGWGNDGWGQLCDDRQAPMVESPEKITLTGPWAAVASGGSTGYLLSTAGEVWACGDNAKGELGQGTKGGDQVEPQKVLSGATQVSSTQHNTAALVG